MEFVLNNATHFTKDGSSTYGKIISDANGFFAVLNQSVHNGIGVEDMYLEGRRFTTEAGARRWIFKKLY